MASKEGDPRVANFHISALYSPHGWLSWPEIADEFVKVHKDPVRLKVWVNTVLGETWEDQEGGTVDSEGLMKQREVYGSEVPDGDGSKIGERDVLVKGRHQGHVGQDAARLVRRHEVHDLLIGKL